MPVRSSTVLRVPAMENNADPAPSGTLAHLTPTEVPVALAKLHRVTDPDGVIEATFASWQTDHLRDVVQGAGFEVLGLEVASDHHVEVVARRLHTLPDYVTADMRMLICGLNPSPASAESGVGFFRAGNRFWPAALNAGLVTVDRDPLDALLTHRIGMTDLAKRTTRRADELRPEEYASGVDRVARIAAWLRPASICMVGLAGWRSVVDRKAKRGWQGGTLGGRRVYVMPSTSGLNAHDTIATLTDHLLAASTD